MNASLLRRKSRGYSLAELLVVVAIIGGLSLVTVPAFINYRNSAKLKSSMRQFAADMRAARQRAITENHPTMISFRVGTNQIAYRDFDGTVASDGTVTYSAITPANRFEKRLDPDVYFAPTTSPCLFDDEITTPAATSGWNDIIFSANGTVENLPTSTTCKNASGVISGIVIVRNDYGNLPRNSYTFEIVSTGRVRVN